MRILMMLAVAAIATTALMADKCEVNPPAQQEPPSQQPAPPPNQ